MDEFNKLSQIKTYTKSKLGTDKTGHGYDHIKRVVTMAEKILESEPADKLITLTAAYLHDTIDDKLVSNPKSALAELQEFLASLEFTSAQIEEISFIITHMSFAHSLQDDDFQLSLSGQIVQDADWLDAIGAIGITRAIYYGGHHGEKIYNPALAPRTNMTREEYRNLDDETIINHFYEKLLKLKDMLNTPTAKKIAEHRQQVMLDFLDEFKNEWNSVV
ncbi:HD domain-containing protein [Ligilactobacillus salivarius]|uniref:HD domain-containing protein n=1 Tax=Ligilactobacillus salivarius TaxID=1624 RepID=UPI00263A50F5|nr:HD domain-containing protein [Ligilactobacillus salivarius]MDN4847508.1 HD domain-containing protein [Ligilactobacillus salivarius]